MTNTTNYEKKLSPLNSPVFTGTPKAPTQEISSDSNNIATIGNLQNFASINSPVFTGTPKAPTQEISSDSNNIATIGNLQDLGFNPTYFSAYSNSYANMTSGDTERAIKYEKIIAQNANDFDILTSRYTVPISGVYQLNFSISPLFDSPPDEVNKYPFICLEDFATEEIKYTSVIFFKGSQLGYSLSESIYINLKMGDILYVNWKPNGGTFSGILANPFFSGNLIKSIS